ncbi:MAG TPA: hypothetical protein VGI88_12435, partial [Verrucomicrobiae bacterium]
DEIATIEPSGYALSSEVRVVTSEAEEIRMGFAPTMVVAPDNTPYCLNWTANFFIHPTIKAASIRTAPASVRYDASIQVINSSEAQIPKFIGDWQDELVSLRLKTKVARQAFPLIKISSGPIP